MWPFLKGKKTPAAPTPSVESKETPGGVPMIRGIQFVEVLLQRGFEKNDRFDDDVVLALIDFQARQEREYVETGFQAPVPITFVQRYLQYVQQHDTWDDLVPKVASRLVYFQSEQAERIAQSKLWVAWYKEEHAKPDGASQQEPKDVKQQKEEKPSAAASLEQAVKGGQEQAPAPEQRPSADGDAFALSKDLMSRVLDIAQKTEDQEKE